MKATATIAFAAAVIFLVWGMLTSDDFGPTLPVYISASLILIGVVAEFLYATTRPELRVRDEAFSWAAVVLTALCLGSAAGCILEAAYFSLGKQALAGLQFGRSLFDYQYLSNRAPLLGLILQLHGLLRLSELSAAKRRKCPTSPLMLPAFALALLTVLGVAWAWKETKPGFVAYVGTVIILVSAVSLSLTAMADIYFRVSDRKFHWLILLGPVLAISGFLGLALWIESQTPGGCYPVMWPTTGKGALPTGIALAVGAGAAWLERRLLGHWEQSLLLTCAALWAAAGVMAIVLIEAVSPLMGVAVQHEHEGPDVLLIVFGGIIALRLAIHVGWEIMRAHRGEW